ncbi:MAG: hypothetical protein HY420_03905 [Candidatus Kerfeldbacteria bacterium]|nr:hypothetical protein [Candidatus Kerfeldbacteria bacterium]
MIDFAEIERLDFAASDSLSKLDSLLGEVAGYAETRSSAEIANILETKKKANPSLEKSLDPYIARFRALALPLLTDTHVAAVLGQVASIVADERVSLYERLRARLLVLPESRRAVFSQNALEQLRKSEQKLGPSTVAAWVRAFERVGGPKDTKQFFNLPEFKQLDDQTDHAVRHFVHVVTLLTETGAGSEPPAKTIIARAIRPAATPPKPPDNLPIAPSPSSSPSGRGRAVPAIPQPLASVPDRGPGLAAVMARLHQTSAASTEPSAVAHLTPEDHQEIAEHAERLSGLAVEPNVHAIVPEAVQNIINKAGLKFADEHLEQRFASIITSRLKGIRRPAEAVELLTRAIKIGGLGYDQALADRIINEANAVAERFHDRGEVKKIAEEQKLVNAPPMPLPPKVPEAPPPVYASTQPPATSPGLPPPFRPAIIGAPAAVRINEPPSPVALPPLPTAALRPVVSDRPQVSDIRGTSRLVGPVEELHNMTLVDYRRLGQTAVQCVRRVYEKIQRLGLESFSKKAEGIRAWRESEVYRLYLNIGQESLLANKAIRQIVGDRQTAGKPTLSEEEFMLVADLNKKLRF